MEPVILVSSLLWLLFSTSGMFDVMLTFCALLGARGLLGHTKKGEPTLWVTELTLLAKAVAPPPEKWHGLTDIEARYRRVHQRVHRVAQDVLQRARVAVYARHQLAGLGIGKEAQGHAL